MFILNTIMIIISIAVLFTLRRMRDIFRTIEIIVYYMVIVVAIEQIHSAIIDNFKLIEYAAVFSKFIFYKLNQLIVSPIATLWLLYSFFSPRNRLHYKAFFVLIWFFALHASYKVFEYLGIFKLTGWHIGYTAVVWLTVLVESLCFALWFRRLLRKRDDNDPVPARTV